MRNGLAAAAALAIVASATAVTGAPAPRAYTAISLEGLSDGIRHYRNRNGSDYATYAPVQIVEIADNILLLQRSNGGWIENQDPTRVLAPAERVRMAADQAKPDISFDNRNVTGQVAYLAAAFEQSGDARYRGAALRGVAAMLAHQDAVCGGWPHTVPPHEPYHAHITIADDVTSGMLALLRRVAAAARPYGFVTGDGALRARVAQAVARGDACLLRLQVIQRGTPAGWAGQYDRQTLRPALGRSFELPAMVTWESTGVLRYLMSIPEPSPEIVRAVETGAAWLQRSKLGGLRLETFPAEPVRYQYHSSSTDRRLIEDPSAPPLWARFYDLDDNSVVLANRDGKRVTKYADITRERRTGYAWYGDWPAKLLADEYPVWRERLDAAAIAAIVAPAGGVVGFAAVDLVSGRSMGLHQREPFPTQSVFKAAVAIEVLRQVDAGLLDLGRAVVLVAGDARGGPAGTMQVPAQSTIGELLAAMLITSDNVACDKLLSLIGGPKAVDARMRALGADDIHIQYSELEMGAGGADNSATPASMVALFARVARHDVGLTAASARRLDDLLLRVATGAHRIKGALPPGTLVAHKTGTSRTQNGKTDATNDAGLMTLPNGHKIAIAVFVHASPADEATREATIARLARLAYDAFGGR